MVDISTILPGNLPSKKAKPLPPSILPEVGGTFAAKIDRLAEDAGMPAADPVRAVLVALASNQDRIDAGLRGSGMDAGKIAAEAARRELSAGLHRMALRAGATRWAVLAGCLTLALWTGYTAGRNLPVTMDEVSMPAALARVLPLQDWHSQFAACRPQPKANGLEWCLMPVVTKIPKL